MSLAIRGLGWVTPLGNGLEEVWQRLMAGERAPVADLRPPHPGGHSHLHSPVPLKQVEALGRTPRVRRSSAITYFTATAGLAALENAGLKANPEIAARTAVIYAICSGGVVYTRRFYEKIVADGPSAASPLLFPETVYNAPASHLAALMGIDGASYTLVGDASVGISALSFAEELLATDPTLDQCVVVGGEECDWILCEGYASWRLLARKPSGGAEQRARGMLLAEGAAALVVGRGGTGGLQVETAAAAFTRRTKAGAALDCALGQVSVAGSGLVIASANGTWIDAVEAERLACHLPGVPVYHPKVSLGEALGASSLLQVAVGALALERGHWPGAVAGSGGLNKVTVTAIGLNQQAAGAVLTPSQAKP